LRITVLGTRRKNGVASALLAHLIRQLVASGVATLFLEVRAHNHPALQFYRKHGFIEIGLRRKYYDDPQDDALIFSKNLLYD
jgi:ribosomal-protein-alanine N-acetyltransferase